MSTRAERSRYVAKVRREIEKDERRNPPRPTTAAQRRRIVEVLALQAGLPLPQWRLPRQPAAPIDARPIKAAWDEIQRDRLRRYAAYDIALEDRCRRARCSRCGEVLLDVPSGLVGITPSALFVWHHQRTGCV